MERGMWSDKIPKNDGFFYHDLPLASILTLDHSTNLISLMLLKHLSTSYPHFLSEMADFGLFTGGWG